MREFCITIANRLKKERFYFFASRIARHVL